MIKTEDMKVGLLVWWSAERYTKSWSCPAIVTKVTKDWFKVKSLDDFKETDELRMNDIPDLDKSSRKTEMRTCGINEVKEYFQKRIRRLEDNVTKTERSLQDAKASLTAYKKMTEDFLVEVK